MRIGKPSPGTVLALTALVVALGGVAYATIPDSSGTIHGCYGKSNGNLRVVESASVCRNSEQALAWNQEGPPGSSTVRLLGDVTISGGESRVLLSEGPLTLIATCEINMVPPGFEQPRDVAEIGVSTTQEHSAFGGSFNSEDDLSPSEGSLNTLRAPATGFTVGRPQFHSSRFFAAAPDGTRLSGVLVASVNGLGRTGQCGFGGHVVVG